MLENTKTVRIGKQYTAPVRTGERKYEAASFGRRTRGWDRQNRSPAADQEPALRHLRGLSRDLVRNNPYAKRAIEVIANNVVSTGIRPAFAGTKTQIKKAKEWWRLWGDQTACDHAELMTIYGIQKAVMRAVAESGDALVLRQWVKDPNSPLGFELKVLESDFLDDSKTMLLDDGMILQGVEYDKNLKRRAYWLYKEHPGSVMMQEGLQSAPVPAKDVIHVFEVLRPGQVRGIPMGVSAFVRLKDLDEFQDAQLYKQKIAALFVMCVTDSLGTDGLPTNKSRDEYMELDKMSPGIIEYLPQGKDVVFSNPPKTEGYSDFVATNLRAVAVAYGITYESLTNDYSLVNFSSGRMGKIEMGLNIRDWQDNIMIALFCNRIFGWFRFGLSMRETGITQKFYCTWTTPRIEMIDPAKEGKAIIELVRANLMSLQEAIRQSGNDPDDVYMEIAQDKMQIDSLGTKPTSDPRFDLGKDAQIIQLSKPTTSTTKK